MGAAQAKQGHEVADELFRELGRVENAADTGGNGSDGLQLPQVEPFVELAALQLFAELPGAEAQAGGAESGLVETFEVQEPQTPAAVIRPEWDLAPTVGGLLDLRRHGPGPARNGFFVATQNPGSRAGFLDHSPEQFFREIGAGATAEGNVSKAQEIRQTLLPGEPRGRPRDPGRSRRTVPNP